MLMYVLYYSLSLTCFVGAILFLNKKAVLPTIVLGLGAIALFSIATFRDGDVIFVPLERADCVVQMKSYEKYTLKCAVAFNELIPIVEADRTTLNGMHIEWNNGAILKSRIGDTIYVYRMAAIETKPWSTDTTIYLCANRSKKDNHEYDLFQQYLKKGIKEESIDTP